MATLNIPDEPHPESRRSPPPRTPFRPEETEMNILAILRAEIAETNALVLFFRQVSSS